MDYLTKEVVVYIQKTSKKFLQTFSKEQSLTTYRLSSFMKVDRSTASRILNQLFKENKLIKINVRPVVFVSMEHNLKAVLDKTYTNIEQFRNSYEKAKKEKPFKEVIGYKHGLKKQIEQIKAGLKYPKNGLPVMILGESGTGKSFLVKKAYEYGKATKILGKDAPFFTVNCAQYVDNPELLSSILFGYTKGAFTGADRDKKGVIEESDKGILFLDEVHRLGARGQERLFNYLDNGYFSPIGSNSKKRYSTARLMFATTMQSTDFLETFMRRVPIVIEMPSLEKRGLIEKKELINLFLNSESHKVQKDITVTGNALSKLYHHHYIANVGEAQKEVKNLVALVYSENSDKDILKIKSSKLPTKFFETNCDDTYPLEQTVTFGYKRKIIFKTNNETNAENQILKAWKSIQTLSRKHVTNPKRYEYVVNNLMKYFYPELFILFP